jgi:hypothetical protein
MNDNDDDIDFSAPLYDLMPPEVLRDCRNKVVDRVSWAMQPTFGGGGRAIFRDATPLYLAFSWLEPYRTHTNIALVRFTDGTMLRIRRGRLLEVLHDERIFPHDPGLPPLQARRPICEHSSLDVDRMMCPFPGTGWLVPGRILLGPAFGPQVPDAEAKALTLMAYGVTKVLMISTGKEGIDHCFDGMEDSIARLREKTEALGWALQAPWTCIRRGKDEETHAAAGRLLDTILAHRPECGLLYLCADTLTLDYIAWLWHLYYDSVRITVLVDERPTGPKTRASLSLHEAMRSPPKGYPAGY